MNKRQISYALAFWPKSPPPALPPQTIDYVPADSRTRRGFRFRVVIEFALLAVGAYLTSQHIGANPSSYAQAAAGNWFVIALLCGTVSSTTAFLSYLLTGRAWNPGTATPFPQLRIKNVAP